MVVLGAALHPPGNLPDAETVLEADPLPGAAAGWGLTRRELATAVERAEAVLAGAGVGPGVTLALALPSRPDLVVALLAARRLDAFVVLVDTLWWPRELRAVAELCRPDLVLADAATAEAFTDLAPTLVLAPPTGPAGLLAAERPASARPPRPPAVPGLATGTTGAWGEPQLFAFSYDQVERYWPPTAAAEDLLLATSVAHAAGLRACLANLAAGGRVRLVERWRPRSVLARLAARPADRLWASGPQLTELATVVARRGGGGARAAAVDAGGGRLLPGAARRLEATLGAAVVTRYTLTEAGGWAAASEARPAGAHDPLDVGHAVTGVELRFGEAPEQGGQWRAGGAAGVSAPACPVTVAGPATARSRLAPGGTEGSGGLRVVETARPAAGWDTGDLGQVDGAGRLHLLGRLAERFRCGPGLVDPVPVELAIAEHPAIADVAVTLRPHPTEGAVPVAVTVPLDPEHPPFLDDLAAVLAALAPHARPRAQAVVERLPLSGGGHLHRRMLALDERER